MEKQWLLTTDEESTFEVYVMLDDELGDLMNEELILQLEEAKKRIKGYQETYFQQAKLIGELMDANAKLRTELAKTRFWYD